MRRHSSTSDGLLAPLFTSPDVEAELSDAALLQAMLDVEAALARAGVDVGVVPADAADAVAAACRADRFEIAELGAAAVASGNPVVPLVHALRAAVGDPEAQWVHFATTSQDVLDTALMLLVLRSGEPLLRHVRQAADVCAALADRHRDTVMVARTLGRQAVPTTFGLKASGWLSGIDSAGRRVRNTVRDRAAVQLGGAAGTLAGYGTAGPAVMSVLARHLGLADPGTPWHTDRQRLLEIADAVAAIGPAFAKVAVDVVSMASSEVGEVQPSGPSDGGPQRGGSSAMPNKTNPVDAVLVRGGALQMPGLVATLHDTAVHEHERAAGAWHAEWESLRRLISLAGGVAERGARLVAEIRVDTARMRANLDAGGGEVMAEALVQRLRPLLGTAGAGDAVRRCLDAARNGETTFRDAISADEQVRRALGTAEIAEILDPRNWLGSASQFVDRALRAHEQVWS
jgi:3-carboxy-cis,cis-muconate cycloisomerase